MSSAERSARKVGVVQFRVRYSEIDRMGTFYNSRALEWFECGRVEFLRFIGLPYDRMEAQGFFLPVIEAHVEYLGRASFDELLEMRTTASMAGKARVRFDVHVARASQDGTPGGEVVRGYTAHAVSDAVGRPVRPPAWLAEALGGDGARPSPAALRSSE